MLDRFDFVVHFAFNPILVWFQHYEFKMRLEPEKPFNPILVWFQRAVNNERRCSKINETNTFNPILVWFQLMFTGVSVVKAVAFNPILVWFQRDKGLDYDELKCLIPFNPILVWFQPHTSLSPFAIYSFLIAFLVYILSGTSNDAVSI